MSVAPPPLERSDASAAPSDRVAETQARILDEAAACFARYGFARTRVDDVAEAAGVSRPLIYGYFGTKGKLLQRVQERVLGDWSAALEAVVKAAASPAEALAAWVRLALSDTARRPLLRALFDDRHAGGAVGWQEAAGRTRGEWLERLAALLRSGIDAGDFRADLDVEATAIALRTLQNGLIAELLADPPRSDVDAERQIAAGIDLMLNGLRPSPPAPN